MRGPYLESELDMGGIWAARLRDLGVVGVGSPLFDSYEVMLWEFKG